MSLSGQSRGSAGVKQAVSTDYTFIVNQFERCLNKDGMLLDRRLHVKPQLAITKLSTQTAAFVGIDM